mgnify:FL=1
MIANKQGPGVQAGASPMAPTAGPRPLARATLATLAVMAVAACVPVPAGISDEVIRFDPASLFDSVDVVPRQEGDRPLDLQLSFRARQEVSASDVLAMARAGARSACPDGLPFGLEAEGEGSPDPGQIASDTQQFGQGVRFIYQVRCMDLLPVQVSLPGGIGPQQARQWMTNGLEGEPNILFTREILGPESSKYEIAMARFGHDMVMASRNCPGGRFTVLDMRLGNQAMEPGAGEGHGDLRNLFVMFAFECPKD